MCLFFFKQKTAYEMRISDWSSDVCSSDLLVTAGWATSSLIAAAPSGLPLAPPAAFARSPPCRPRQSGLVSPRLHKGNRDMAQFVLPKNSRPQKTGTVHKAEGATAVKKFKEIGRAHV